jgi:hypothetical protein
MHIRLYSNIYSNTIFEYIRIYIRIRIRNRLKIFLYIRIRIRNRLKFSLIFVFVFELQNKYDYLSQLLRFVHLKLDLSFIICRYFFLLFIPYLIFIALF